MRGWPTRPKSLLDSAVQHRMTFSLACWTFLVIVGLKGLFSPKLGYLSLTFAVCFSICYCWMGPIKKKKRHRSAADGASIPCWRISLLHSLLIRQGSLHMQQKRKQGAFFDIASSTINLGSGSNVLNYMVCVVSNEHCSDASVVAKVFSAIAFSVVVGLFFFYCAQKSRPNRDGDINSTT